VSRTSTFALTNATTPYAMQIAKFGWPEVARKVTALRRGVNIVKGKIVYPGVAEAFGFPCESLDKMI